jgi:hypothetical protein
MDSSTHDVLTVQRFMERYAEEKELGFSKVYMNCGPIECAACCAACIVIPSHRQAFAIVQLCACAELSEGACHQNTR